MSATDKAFDVDVFDPDVFDTGGARKRLHVDLVATPRTQSLALDAEPATRLELETDA